LPPMHVVIGVLSVPFTPELDESVRRGSTAVARSGNIAANEATEAFEFVGQVTRPSGGMEATDKENARHVLREISFQEIL